MFRSQVSGKQSKKYESPVKVITEVRQVTYINPKGKVTTGYEPVKEVTMLAEEAKNVNPCMLVKSDKRVVTKRAFNEDETPSVRLVREERDRSNRERGDR